MIIVISLVAFAWLRTINKTELEFIIRLDPTLIQVSTYGEPPTFAIWVENSRGDLANVYVTRRAYTGDWEGKPDVPVALPYWFSLNRSGKLSMKDRDAFLKTDAVTGATPKEDLFIAKVMVPPDSTYECWIEMNLAGDFNQYYKEMDPEKMKADEFANGQPALVYHGTIKAVPGNSIEPGLYGMTLIPDSVENIIQPVKGITTADKVFNSIRVEVVRPKPYLIRKSLKSPIK